MTELNVSSGGGNLRADFARLHDRMAVMSDLEQQITQADGPAVMFQLMLMKQALDSQIRWQQWVDKGVAALRRDAEVTTELPEAHAATHRLLRRAQATIVM